MGEGQQIFAATLVLLSLLSSAAGYCSQGSEWIEYNDNCYHWSRTGVNWFRAELNCKQSGGHLVSIKSQNDNNFLLRLTQCSTNFWIGMVNASYSQNGHGTGYEWWDGTQHNYTRFNVDHISYRDCVFSYNNGNWQNHYCQNSFGYVCMTPAAHHQEDVADKQQTGSEQQPKEQQDVNAVWWTIDYSTVLPTEHTTPWPEQTTSVSQGTELPITEHTTPWPEQTTSVSQGTESPLWPTPTQSPSKCQSGWQLMDNSCYFVSANRTNYFNAQMSCQAMGASVTSILTRREHTLLTVAIGCHSPKWIGLEKARPCFKQPTKDHCWVWMDRSPVVYFDWASGQTIDRRDTECVILDGQWKVMNCYAEYGYICKMPAYGLKTSA